MSRALVATSFALLVLLSVPAGAFEQRPPVTPSVRAAEGAQHGNLSVEQAREELWRIIGELDTLRRPALRGGYGRELSPEERDSLLGRLDRRRRWLRNRSPESLRALQSDLQAIPRHQLELENRVNYDVARYMLFERVQTPVGNSVPYPIQARLSTSLDLSPRQLHRIGLVEVERIRPEMEALMRSTRFEGTLTEFFEFLRTDARFFADTQEELLLEATEIAAAIEEQLPRLFNTLPETPFVVQLYDSEERDSLSAFYRGIAPGRGGRDVGRVVLEGNDLRRRPLWGLEALLFHEAVPGHHLQQALQAENNEIPEFRGTFYLAAFVEGCARRHRSPEYRRCS